MNPATLRALQSSIEHWERMRNNPKCEEVPDAKDCHLCQIFTFANEALSYSLRCNGCPVAERGRHPHCSGSPWSGAYCRWHERNLSSGSWARWRKAADAEIAFLKSLLPKRRVKARAGHEGARPC